MCTVQDWTDKVIPLGLVLFYLLRNQASIWLLEFGREMLARVISKFFGNNHNYDDF